MNDIIFIDANNPREIFHKILILQKENETFVPSF